MVTARALGAMAIEAELPGRVRSIRGNGDGSGAFVVVEFTGGRGAHSVYLQTLATSDDERRPRPCGDTAHAAYVDIAWCDSSGREQRLVLVVDDRKGRLVTGEVRTQTSIVTVDATNVGGVDEATAFLRRLLADDRLGFRTTDAAIAAGEALQGFETMPLGFGVTDD